MQLTEEEIRYVSSVLSSLSVLEKSFSENANPSRFCFEGKIFRYGEVIGKIKWDELSESYVFKPNKKYLGD